MCISMSLCSEPGIYYDVPRYRQLSIDWTCMDSHRVARSAIVASAPLPGVYTGAYANASSNQSHKVSHTKDGRDTQGHHHQPIIKRAFSLLVRFPDYGI